MSYRHHTHLSTSELFDYSYLHRIFNGIQQAKEGSSPDRQPWYDKSSPYMLCKARAEAVQLNWGDTTPLTTAFDTITTSSYHTTSVTTFPFSLPRHDTRPTPEPRSTAETVIYDR